MKQIGAALGLAGIILAVHLPGAAAQQKKRSVKIPSRVPGVIVKVLVKEGTAVQKGTLLAQVDDKLAAVEMKQAQARVEIAKMEYASTEATAKEAEVQYQLAVKFLASKAISEEEVRIKKLTLERLEYEMKAKRAALHVVDLEYQKRQIIVDMHRITAPASGIIGKVHKQPGEAVKQSETLFELVQP